VSTLWEQAGGIGVALLRSWWAGRNAPAPAPEPAPSLDRPPWEGQAPPWEGTDPPWGASPPPDPGYDSYAAGMEHPSVACRLCTNRHLRAMADAAEKMRAALAAGDEEEARRQNLRLAAEGLVMDRFAWTPKKLAATPDEDRAAIEAAASAVREVMSAAPRPPDELALAWGSVDEGTRFARSRHPTGLDRAELSARLDAAEDQIAACDDTLAPHRVPEELRPHADYALEEARRARHAITGGGALDEANRHLHNAAMAWTPLPTPEEADRLCTLTAEAKARFQRAVMRRAQLPAAPAG
jgi:hypothetical protein